MTSSILLAALIGTIAGAVFGYWKFRNPLPAGVAGAVAGAVLYYCFGPAPGSVIAVETPDEFRTDVLQSDTPVLVDFYASWCGPCKKLAPVLRDLSEKYEGKAKFVKVDVEEGPVLARAYNVRTIPTVILFVKSSPVRKWVGCMDPAVYRSTLDAVISGKVPPTSLKLPPEPTSSSPPQGTSLIRRTTVRRG